MIKLLFGIFLLLTTSLCFSQSIELEKKDYLSFVVANYFNGFNEFDTSIVSFSDSVSIGIYYDSSIQERARAEKLAERFREQIKIKLKEYEWAKYVAVKVNVYSEANARAAHPIVN